MYKMQGEGENQVSADHRPILLRGWGGCISVNGVLNISLTQAHREASLSGEQHDEVDAAQLRSSPLGHLLQDV